MKTRMLIGALIALFGVISLVKADDGTWEALNPVYFMNQVKSIDIGYTNLNEKYIYAAEAGTEGKLRYSTNDGVSWVYSELEVGDHGVLKVAVEKENFNIAWALIPGNDRSDAQAGPYRYERSPSNRWEQKANGLENSKLLGSMAVNYNSTNLIAAYVGGDGMNQGDKYLFKWADGNGTWQQIGQPDQNGEHGIPYDNSWPAGKIVDIEVSSSQNPQVIYCLLDWGRLQGDYNNAGIYRSTDGGQLWDFLGAGGYWRDIAIDPNDPTGATIFASRYRETLQGVISEVYISADYGIHWIWPPVLELEHDRFDCICRDIKVDDIGSIYMAFSSPWPEYPEFVIKHYEGQNIYLPSQGENPVERKAWSIAIDPRNRGELFVGTEYHLYKTTDAGGNFVPVVNGGSAVTLLGRIGVGSSSTCIMSDYPPFGSLYRSTNSGSDWNLRCQTLYPDIGFVSPPPYDVWRYFTSSFIGNDLGQNQLWFASGYDWDVDRNLCASWILKSTDNGYTWNYLPISPAHAPLPNAIIKGLGINRFNDYVYACAWSPAWAPYQGLWINGNNGEGGEGDWAIKQYASGQVMEPSDIQVHPSQAATIVVADELNGLYRSTDNGVNWNPINGGSTITNAHRIRYCPGEPRIALVGTTTGIYKSADMDQLEPTWVTANNGGFAGNIEDIAFNPDDNSVICVSGSGSGIGYMYLSADTARSWIKINSGLTSNRELYDISVDIANPDTFYAATNDGIYKLKNPVKCGILVSDETWGPGTVIVNGDVEVPVGVTLTIAAGTTVKFVYNFDKRQTGSNINKSELLVQGSLKAQGTTINPIVFESSSPADGNWSGIMAETYSNIDMDYCTIRNAVYGIYAYKPAALSITHCQIDSNSTIGNKI